MQTINQTYAQRTISFMATPAASFQEQALTHVDSTNKRTVIVVIAALRNALEANITDLRTAKSELYRLTGIDIR